MRRGAWIVVLLLLCGWSKAIAQPKHARVPAPPPPAVSTQVYLDATRLGSPIVLDKSWRVGVTSDPAAATPGFDDSNWSVREASESMADVSDDQDEGQAAAPEESKTPPRAHHGRPFVWFRLHIKLAPNHGPLALLIEMPVAHGASLSLQGESPGVEVFANGKLIRPGGPHADTPEQYLPISRLYELNIDPGETSLVLVLRTIYVPVGLKTYTAFFANRTLRLGDPVDLNHNLELWTDHSLYERLPRLVNSILLVILAGFLFALYFTQRGHTEYLWLALHELAQAPLNFIDLAGSTAELNQLWYGALFLQLLAISAYLYFEFLVSFLDLGRQWAGKRKRWFILLPRYTAPVLLAIGPATLGWGHGTLAAVFFFAVIAAYSVWYAGWLIFCFFTLISATARRNFEAGLLLLPLVLTFIGIIEPAFTSGMAEDWTGRSYKSPLTIQAGPVPIHFASIADFVSLLAIVIIIFFRFLRIHRDQERASSELAAARSMQELMIPQEQLFTPGFEVDSVYNPANEVGGDFYHVEPHPEGGLLVVIGDVAGKGLKAAMNVSMLVGALRRSTERSPAKILRSLNRVLTDSDSFTTCQAAWFGENGEVVLANAGHLPPYLNSQEVFVPGGLPLGVLPDSSYDEVRLYLHPGDRLLLLSDGVVEARHASGELFGFERVHNLSNQSAFYIADAAKSFGQEDDITVLTVRRMERGATTERSSDANAQAVAS